MNNVYVFRYDLLHPNIKFHLVMGARTNTHSLCRRLKLEPFDNLQIHSYVSELMSQRNICGHCLRKLRKVELDK